MPASENEPQLSASNSSVPPVPDRPIVGLPADGPITGESAAAASAHAEIPAVEAAAPAPDDEIDEYEPLTPEIVEEEAIRGDFVLRWAVVLLAFLLGSTCIIETASLVHIKTGQYLAAHGFIPPATDVFSYTALDRPWLNLSWGFDLLAAGIYAVGSFTGLSVFKAVVIAIAFWLIGTISRPGLPTWWGSICSAAALLGCHLRLSAEPGLMTFLGLALALCLVFRWRDSLSTNEPEKTDRGLAKRLWVIVPLFFLWSNLDARAWVGLAFLVLFAAGDSLAGWLASPAAISGAARRHLWTVTGASIVATLAHPFGWKSLAAPWFAYGVEYPAWRDYLSEAVLGEPKAPGIQAMQYFSMLTEGFWTGLWSNPDPAGIAALAVLVAAAVTIVLNRARLDWAQVAIYLGFVLLAVACLHELPVAGIVGCVVATLNGQGWYAATCRQTYSVETRELVFSRGGRGLTVVLFAALAFFGGTGKLRDSAAGAVRTGYGLDHNLEMQLDDLRLQLAGDASFDHRPFNVLLTQGDQLIWVDEQVFVDSRVAVYHAADEEDSLLAQHLHAREALLPHRNQDDQKFVKRPNRQVWKKAFNKHHVSHIVVRLMSPRDYELFFNLLQDESNWEWTNLGAVAAVLYRKDADADEPQLVQYVETHGINFLKQAFRTESPPFAGRDRWIRPPSFYQKYFWSSRQDQPPEIHKALHLVLLASAQGLPPRLQQSQHAMLLLAIRGFQAGLVKAPNSVRGYLFLGQAYDFLAKAEAARALNGSRSHRAGMRYLQTVAAYNQALVGDPDNPAAHKELMQVYFESRRLDLALRHLEAYDQFLASDPDVNAKELEQTGEQLGQLRKRLQQIDEEVAQQAVNDKNPINSAQRYLQQGCILRALRELDRGGPEIARDPRVEQGRIRLMLEAGQVEDAYNAAGRFAEIGEQAGLPDWADVVALASLPFADYNAATERWQTAANVAEKQALNGLLLSAAPHNTNSAWPLSVTASATGYFYQAPEAISNLRLNVALTYLEEGQLQYAEEFFRDALASNPETASRPFIGYYLWELSGRKEEIDFLSPSNRVFELFAPEPGEEEKTDESEEH